MNERGFSLIEVMVAMVVLAFGLLGAMASFQSADHGLQEGAKGTRALALVESRLEAKRAMPWQTLLSDDLNADGMPDVLMHDDGQPPDQVSSDGIYTAGVDTEGISLVWTIQPDRSGPLQHAGSVVILAAASYSLPNGQRRTVRLGTLRANPVYVGW
jgi:prepilin-type N-terminal cleavage/methylation domain-containing protein